MTRCFIATLGTETNSFSPMPTGWAQFEETCMVRRGEHGDRPRSFGGVALTYRQLAEARGWEVVESLCAFAMPAGPTVRAVYEALRDEVLADLRAAMPVDVVLLSLHGAMIAEGYDDCEGDLIRAIRANVGPAVPIGAALDPHAHLFDAMVDHATVLAFFKEYPHTDAAERAADVFHLVADTLAGRVRPAMSVYDCRMIGIYHTNLAPMRAFVDRISALEGRDGVLSISVVHGFPWGDTAETGTKLLVVTDNQPERGAALAEALGRELIALRGRTTNEHLPIDTALDRALASRRGPVVLADVSDNAGGGAPGDSTFLLRAMLERGVRGAALACIWDPIVVSLAFAGGEGATFDVRLGGKLGPASGAPIDARATVTRLARNAVQRRRDLVGQLGDAAALRIDGIDVVVNSLRTQTLSPDCFTGLGIDPAERRILVVKSSQHFRAAFEPIAAEILYVATPGAIPPDVTIIPYRKVRRPKWPLDPDLFDREG